MAQRHELQALLSGLTGVTKAYFQPPKTTQMTYPCILYTLADIDTEHANDKPYLHRRQYLVTVIDSNPDSLIPAEVGSFPLCEFDRFYTADQLNHFVFRLYF